MDKHDSIVASLDDELEEGAGVSEDIVGVASRCAEVASGASAILVDWSEDVRSITPAKLYALSAALDEAARLLDGIS